MGKLKNLLLTKKISLMLGFFLVFVAGTGYALDVSINPAKAQRAIGGKLRVHINANTVGDENLISFGVKVSFDPTVLQVNTVVPANNGKNTDLNTGFVMDEDGLPGGTQYTTPDIVIDNGAGTVTMIGGRLTGPATTGLTGKVLLGWITFNVIGAGNSDLTVDLAKYHPNDPDDTFDNFVGNGGPPVPVYDSTLTMSNSILCARANAREGDINGNGVVYFDDYAIFFGAWNTSFGNANYNPAADLDGDGTVYFSDYALFYGDWQQPVLSCP